MLGEVLRRGVTRPTRIVGEPAPNAASGVGSGVWTGACTGADGGAAGSADAGVRCDAGGEMRRAAVWLPFYVCRTSWSVYCL